jgi:hypothetical protein
MARKIEEKLFSKMLLDVLYITIVNEILLKNRCNNFTRLPSYLLKLLVQYH